MIQYIRFSKLNYLYLFFSIYIYIYLYYLLFKSVLNFVSFFFPMKYNAFYIQLLYKVRYFVNNVMCNWNSSIHLEWLKKESNISKFITYIKGENIILVSIFLTCSKFFLYHQFSNKKGLCGKWCALLPHLKLMWFIK